MSRQLTNISYLSLTAVFLIACGSPTEKVVAPGDIVVTEVMPKLGSGDPHWFELHNSTNALVNISQCEVSNTQRQAFTLSDNVIVQPEEYIVIASDSVKGTGLPQALSDAAFTYQSNNFELLSTGGITLSCKGKLIDKITYQIGAATVAAEARSWQLASSQGNNNNNTNENNWCYTIMLEKFMVGDRRFSTPGKTNPICESVMPYVSYDNQKPVLIEGIDWEATLKVAEAEFARELSTSELAIWAIRDQLVPPEVATRIATLYFKNIDMLYDTAPFTRLDWNHAVWHLSWAISNLYRNGDAAVKTALQLAYDDAIKRPETLERYTYIAIDHIRNDVVVMGDIHTPAHNRMKQLVVAPGNPEYLQSYDEYLENRRNPLTLKAIHFLYTLKTLFSAAD